MPAMVQTPCRHKVNSLAKTGSIGVIKLKKQHPAKNTKLNAKTVGTLMNVASGVTKWWMMVEVENKLVILLTC